MEQIIVKQEIIESVYKEISILEKLEEKYDETLDLIKDFNKSQKESFELNREYFSFENRNDGKVSEKVLKYIQKGEKLNAMKVYKDENNVSLNVARNYIDKISKDYKYKL